MRRILFLIFLIVFNIGDVHVKGYWRKDGTYVKPHYRTRANRTVTDNYIYKGNVNSYTGAVGSNYYKNDESSLYYEKKLDCINMKKEYNILH